VAAAQRPGGAEITAPELNGTGTLSDDDSTERGECRKRQEAGHPHVSILAARAAGGGGARRATTAYSIGQQLIISAWDVIFAIALVSWVFGWRVVSSSSNPLTVRKGALGLSQATQSSLVD
jgi:hypothetical protein